MLRHSKQDILYVFIDSNIANEDYAALDRQALDKFASYANNDLFHFRRSPNDTRYRDLQKIQQYQKITDTNKEVLKIELERDSFFRAPERSRIDDLTKILFIKESVTEGEKDLIFWVLLNVDIMSLNKYGQTLFVTLNKEIRTHRRWQNEFLQKGFYIVDINQAMEFMDLFAKRQNKYYCTPYSTMNKGYWYLSSFRSKIAHYHVPERNSTDPIGVMEAFASRFMYLLITVDELGMEHYFPTDTKIMNPYYFSYFIALTSGIFDNLAIETRAKYHLQFKGDNNPSRTSLSPETGRDFLGAVKEANSVLREHIKEHGNLISLIYSFREPAVHREAFKTMGYRGKRNFINFFVIDNKIKNMIKSCGDKPNRFDDMTIWGISEEYFTLLEPYAFSKSVTGKLVEFCDKYLELLGYENFLNSSSGTTYKQFAQTRLGC